MKYAEMGSVAIIYKFHKDCFRHSKVYRGDSQTHRQHGDLISLLLFFQNKESMLKKSGHLYLYNAI
jgi:hypothetical protein